MASVEDTSDIFESSLSLEDSHLRQGFENGFHDGVEAGRAEGREAGRKVGFEFGAEVGFYTGCVDIWKAVLGKDPHAFSARSQKAIKLLEEQLHAVALSNTEVYASSNWEDSQDMLDIRARFRAILSLLSFQIQGASMHDRNSPSF